MTQPSHRIVYNNFSGGMFGMVKSVLCAIHRCEQQGFTPQVWVGDSPYREDGYEGNIWTRFFEPIGDPMRAPDSTEVVAYHPELNGRDYSAATREHMRGLLARHVQPCAQIRDRIARWTPRMLGCRVGMHYRGGDGHQVHPFVAPGAYARALTALRDSSSAPWLLATDSDAAATELDLPGRILTDSVRVPELQSSHGIHFRAGDRGKAGSDAILDAWLLSRCQILVCGRSNLSDVAMYLNPDLLRVCL